MAETNKRRRHQFRSLVGDQAFNIETSGESVFVEGAERDVSLVRVRDRHYSLLLDGRSYSLVVDEDGGDVVVSVGGRELRVRVQNEKDLLLERFGMASAAADGVREVRAPMPGLVVRVLVDEGEEVAAGHGLVVLEAMKMENEIKAETDGRVKSIHVATGDAVGKNALLIEFEV